MRYTIMIITMLQSEVIEFSHIHAETDAEAMAVNDATGDFSATIQGTCSARTSINDTV